MEQGFDHLELEEYSKAKCQFDRMTGNYPENAGAWLMYALSQYKSKLVRDGDESMKAFHKAYAAIEDLERLMDDQKRLLCEGLIRYAEYEMEIGLDYEAKEIVELGKDNFMENLESKALYNKLN